MSRCDVLVVILAAGASRRLGVPKQLVSIGGESLLRRQCRCALSAGVGPGVVILGCDAEEHARTIADLPVEVCINHEWSEGMAASLRCAVDAAMERRSACLILTCDQYRVASSDLRRLHGLWRGAPHVACLSRWGAYAGPPVIIPTTYYDGIRQLRGNRGARALLYGARRPAPREIDNMNAPYDLDCPDDIAIAQAWADTPNGSEPIRP